MVEYKGIFTYCLIFGSMEVADLGRSEDDEASCIDNQISTIKISSYSMEINYSYFKRIHSILYNSA